MNSGLEKHSQTDVVKMLILAFGAEEIAKFGPKSEEKEYLKKAEGAVSKDESLSSIKADIHAESDELSDLSDIHPAWIVKALENETPKIIGIILRWLPSGHVRYILEHLPKRVKMSLPKLVESFAVPTEILRLIKNGFERKFQIPKRNGAGGIKSFQDIGFLKPESIATLFCDLGVHELAMAFQNVEMSGVRVLLNRMNVTSARLLQQRMKSVVDASASLLKDARYTILEVPLDQEDMDKLLVEVGIAAFSKAMKNSELYNQVQLKLDPIMSYVLKRYVDQHVGVNKLAEQRQALILERVSLLLRAGEIE